MSKLDKLIVELEQQALLEIKNNILVNCRKALGQIWTSYNFGEADLSYFGIRNFSDSDWRVHGRKYNSKVYSMDSKSEFFNRLNERNTLEDVEEYLEIVRKRNE